MNASSRHGAARRAAARPGPAAPAAPPALADDLDLIARLLSPVVAAAGMDLEQVKIIPVGRRRLVRVVVDADGGVAVDDIALVSREVSGALEAAGALGDAPYTLEVSSPGTDRPLTQPRHWRRAVGRLVRVPLAGEPGATILGRVDGADEERVTLALAQGSRGFGYGELGPGRIQVEFTRSAEGGGAGGDAVEEEPDGH